MHSISSDPQTVCVFQYCLHQTNEDTEALLSQWLPQRAPARAKEDWKPTPTSQKHFLSLPFLHGFSPCAFQIIQSLTPCVPLITETSHTLSWSLIISR